MITTRLFHPIVNDFINAYNEIIHSIFFMPHRCVMKALSRRRFLYLSGSSAAGALLVSCSSPLTPPAPSETTSPQVTEPPTFQTATSSVPLAATRTPLPTATALPTPQVKNYRRPDLIQFHPQVKSRVVRASDPNVWQGEQLSHRRAAHAGRCFSRQPDGFAGRC